MRHLALLLFAPALLAQAPGMGYGTFEAWMKGTPVPGYKFMECQKDGPEYSAAFMGATPESVLMVRCGPLAQFNQYKSMKDALQNVREFTFRGLKAVSFQLAGMPMLQIELKKHGSYLTLGGPEGANPMELEKLALALKVDEKAK